MQARESSGDNRHSRMRRRVRRARRLGVFLGGCASTHYFEHWLHVDVPTRTLAFAVLIVGVIYAGRLPIHYALGYADNPPRSKRPDKQAHLNRLFAANVLASTVWVAAAAQICFLFPDRPAIFSLCAALYFPVLFLADATAEAAEAAGHRLGSDAVRDWGPIAWVCDRDRRASGLAPLAGIFSFLLEPRQNPPVGTSLVSRFVIWCVVVLYAVVAITALPTLQTAGQRTFLSEFFVAASKKSGGKADKGKSSSSSNNNNNNNNKARSGKLGGGTAKPHARTTGGGTPTGKTPGEGKTPRGNPPQSSNSGQGSSQQGSTYDDHCSTEPGEGATEAAALELYAAVLGAPSQDGIGGNETGCFQRAMLMAGRSDIWYALSRCGGTLRGLAIVAPGWPATVVIQEAAQIAARFAREGILLGVSTRYDIGSGDLIVLATTHGNYLLVRARVSTGGASHGPLWCDDFTSENVSYTIVPPALTGLMLQLERQRYEAGQSWLWPTNDTSRRPAGHDFTFHTSLSEVTTARASCVGDTHCTLWYAGQIWHSDKGTATLPEQLLAYAPPPPKKATPTAVTSAGSTSAGS
jgi:hypothetical protein